MSTVKDPLFSAIGDFGRWQLIVSFMAAIINTEFLWQTLANKFLAEKVEYRCRLMDPRNFDLDDVVFAEDQCSYRIGDVEKQCESWIFDQNVSRNSIVARFDLVCSRSYIPRLAQSLFFSGTLVGTIVAGPLIDRYGRKLFAIPAMVLNGIFTVCEAVSPNITVWLIFRFFNGALGNVAINGMLVYIGENTGGKYRAIVNSYSGAIPSQVSQILLAAFAYAVQDRVMIEYVMAAIAFLVIPFWFILPESPRWLLANGKLDQGIEIVKRIVKTNGKPDLRDEAIRHLRKMEMSKDNHDEERVKYTFFDFFRFPGIRRNLLILCFTWFTTAMGYYGFIYNTPPFDWNVYLVLAFPAILNIPILFLQPILENKFGRKAVYTLTMFFGGLLTFTTLVIPVNLRNLVTILCVIGTTISFSCMVTSYNFTRELFPTILRSSGLTCAVAFSRLGIFAMPWIGALDTFSVVLPVSIYGGFMTVAAVASVWLWPDTHKTKLPDSLEECDDMARGRNTWIKCCKKEEKIVTTSV